MAPTEPMVKTELLELQENLAYQDQLATPVQPVSWEHLELKEHEE